MTPIMPLSSWSRMWQWWTVRPPKVSKATRTLTLLRAGTLTTSCQVGPSSRPPADDPSTDRPDRENDEQHDPDEQEQPDS